MVEEAGIELPACYIEITFTEYDSVDAIEVPEDVISQAEDASGDDGGLLDLDGGGAGVTPAEPAEPVSYTHLDVYKRQFLYCFFRLLWQTLW